jgi:DNA-binding NarL/FixJ family response regulator
VTTAPSFIPIRATERLVDAINKAVELEGDAETRVTFLLRTLQELTHRNARCALWLLDELDREPAPHVRSRTIVFADTDPASIGTIHAAQDALDSAATVTRHLLRATLKTLRTPITAILSRAADPRWFQDVMVKRYLSLTSSADCIVSMWASSRDRAIFLVFHRSDGDAPFTDAEATMVSLMLRAIAPIADREFARRAESDAHDGLSPREREILLMLLAGDSEKQIAAALSRSVNTVHTFVKQIYRRFQVSSRGELMAKFVDQAVLESLRIPTDS